MAAAMRSALAKLGRRACITAPPRMPSLRPAAVRNVEGLRCYSNESFGLADKAKLPLMKGNSEMFMSTWSKRCRETLKTVSEVDHYLFTLCTFGVGIFSLHVMSKFWRIPSWSLESPSHPRPVPDVKDDGKD